VLNASTLDLSAANSVPAIYQGAGTLGFGAWLQSGALPCMNPCIHLFCVHLVDTWQAQPKAGTPIARRLNE
jgi:hypothetical protein